MKKLWMCIHGLLIVIMISPLYVTWIFPITALADVLILLAWGVNATSDCLRHYQKSHLWIMYHERVRYNKLVRRTQKKKEDFPVCMQELSSAVTCTYLFFGSALAFIVLRFVFRLW